MSRYIVMTAAAKMPSSCWGRYGKVAVIETDGEHMPCKIDPRHKSVRRVVACYDRLNIGSTDRCAFRRYLAIARDLADRLNAESMAPALQAA